MDELRLFVAGRRFDGWTRFSVMQSLDFAVDEFDLSVTEHWEGSERRSIEPGQFAALRMGNDLLTTGYIDGVEPSYDANTHELNVFGRSRLADLADCSGTARQFTKQTLLQIAQAICKPFRITVTADSPGTPFGDITISEGQTYWDFLEYAARIRAQRLLRTADGGLHIGAAGRQRAADALVLGGNIKEARGKRDFSKRYSTYTVFGQDDGAGEFDIESVALPQGSADDPGITRYRPLAIIGDLKESPGDANVHARWQRNVHYGRAERVSYTVQGFRQSDGSLWRPGLLVPVRDPYQMISGDRIISDVTFTRDEKGSLTELTVQPVEAFELSALPEPDVQEEFDL